MIMSELSYRRWVALVLGVIVSVGGCAKTSDVHGQGREAGPSGEPILKKDVAGRTYTNAPVEARLGLHRFMIPANYYNDQVGPSPDIGLELTLFWPTLDAAPPGNYAVRTVDEQYRQVSATVVPIDRIPIESVLDRMVTTDGTTEAGSLRRRDPRARLELRARQSEVFGLSPYVIDEVRMPPFAAEYEATYGQQLLRNPDGEKDWYIVRSIDGALVTFIACSSQRLRQDGLLIRGDQVTPDGSGRAAMCSHHFVDAQKRIAFDVSYPRVLLKDWNRMEDAMRGVMDRYQVN
jgi:hypothetical protein